MEASMAEIYVCWISGSCEDFWSAHTTEEACMADLARWAIAYWCDNHDGPLPSDWWELMRRGLPGIQWHLEGPIPLDQPHMPKGVSGWSAKKASRRKQQVATIVKAAHEKHKLDVEQ